MRYPWHGCISMACLALACSEPEAADVVVQPPTVAFALEATADGVEAVFDVGNPNGFPITVDALFVGVDAGADSDATCLPLTADGCAGEAPDWPAGAMLIEAGALPGSMTLPERETVSCHPAIENCVVDGDQWCCDDGARCRPLGDCFGRVIPDGSRCLVCPVHAELRVPLTLSAAVDGSRGAARFSGGALGTTLIVAP